MSKKALLLHLTLAIVAPGCLAAGWWMFSRARHGDPVAWIYTVEWPFFACYAVYMWWKLIHDDPASRRDAMSVPATMVRRPLAMARGARRSASGGLAAADAPEEAEVTAQDGGQSITFDPYDESDPELAAYNRYLASLHERDRRRA
jgi:hypothetical protein